jgi:hypothetical protein
MNFLNLLFASNSSHFTYLFQHLTDTKYRLGLSFTTLDTGECSVQVWEDSGRIMSYHCCKNKWVRYDTLFEKIVAGNAVRIKWLHSTANS